MGEFMKKTKRDKGFTLVEVIVVLVILVILMAIALPALTGYIDNAKEKKVMADAQHVLVAAQAVASEYYGIMPTKTDTEAKTAITKKVQDCFDANGKIVQDSAIAKLLASEMPGWVDTKKIECDAKGNVTAFDYTDGNVTIGLDTNSASDTKGKLVRKTTLSTPTK